VKWAQNRSLGEKWAATSKWLGSTGLSRNISSSREPETQTHSSRLEKFYER